MTDQPNPRCGGTPGKPGVMPKDGGTTRWLCGGCPDCTTPSGVSGESLIEAWKRHFPDGDAADADPFAQRLAWVAGFHAARAESAAEVERLTAELRETREHPAEREWAALFARAEAAEQRLREVEAERDRLRALDGPTMAEYEALVEAFREVDAALDPWLHGDRVDPSALSAAMAKVEWYAASRPVPASPTDEAAQDDPECDECGCPRSMHVNDAKPGELGGCIVCDGGGSGYAPFCGEFAAPAATRPTP